MSVFPRVPSKFQLIKLTTNTITQILLTDALNADLAFNIVTIFFVGDYVQHQCRSGNCVPCNIRFPTCSGMDNGLHEWRGRDKTPYFTQCINERMTLTSRCQSSDPGNSMVFNEATRVCSMAA